MTEQEYEKLVSIVCSENCNDTERLKAGAALASRFLYNFEMIATKLSNPSAVFDLSKAN
jgi:hypothetical protein